jgi:hypothetical protein
MIEKYFSSNEIPEDGNPIADYSKKTVVKKPATPQL